MKEWINGFKKWYSKQYRVNTTGQISSFESWTMSKIGCKGVEGGNKKHRCEEGMGTNNWQQTWQIWSNLQKRAKICKKANGFKRNRSKYFAKPFWLLTVPCVYYLLIKSSVGVVTPLIEALEHITIGLVSYNFAVSGTSAMCTLWRLAFLAFHKIWFGFSLLWPVDRTDRASFVHRARTPPEPPKWRLTNIPTMPLSFFSFFLMVSTEHYCLIMSEAPFPERVRSVWVIENLFLITESFQHMSCASQ